MMNQVVVRYRWLLTAAAVLLLTVSGFAAEAKWIMVGQLHNFYQAHGCEPEEDYGTQQQWGLRWPAFFLHQDSQAARGMWIGVKDFDDPIAGTVYPYKVAHCGPRPRTEIEENEFMPADFGIKLVGKFDHPEVTVDYEPATELKYNDVLDEIDPELTCDRMIVNKVNTSTGISFTRKIYGWSQQYNDNFFIYEFEFENTGIYSKAGDVKEQTLNGVYFHWQYRTAVAGEGTVEGVGISFQGYPGWNTPRDMRWGINTMNDVIGETPDNPKMVSDFPDMANVGKDEFDNSGDIMRAFYTWHGRHSTTEYDNIGSPNVTGYMADGRLGAYQFTGVVALHADKSPDDTSDDRYQPSTTNFIESNAPETKDNSQFDATRMTVEYEQFCSYGHPTAGSQAEQVGYGYPDKFSKDGGYSQAIAFGPYTMQPGEKVRIVMAEGVAGLARDHNVEPQNPNDRQNDLRRKIGNDWFRAAIQGENVDVVFPDGSSGKISNEEEANEYKNLWVYTGRDSIIKTFKQAKDLFNNSLDLGAATPPDPPSKFEVVSAGNYIQLNWEANAESNPNFEGYKVYRALGSMNDSTYYMIADLNRSDNNLANEFLDYTAVRGESYYYYIVSYDNGTTNTIEPGIPLHSSPFYTRTNKAASLLKPPADTLDDIIIVPNPYNIRNRALTFANEPNKIMFFNLPEACTIKIFTERGDLVYEKEHRGSGDDSWNLLTSSRQIVVSGVYIATFVTPEGEKAILKFVIIR